jgi:Domain of unknown function (DUF4124)
MPTLTAMSRPRAVLLASLAGALVCSLLAQPAQAQWKWRDKAGQTQYSDLAPPPGTPEADILQRPNVNPARAPLAAAPAASGASAADGLKPKTVEPELEAKRRKAEQEKADKAKADDEKRAAAQAANCTQAKSYLSTLQDGIRITRTGANGEREFLDDKARADETRRARDVIAADCKK